MKSRHFVPLLQFFEIAGLSILNILVLFNSPTYNNSSAFSALISISFVYKYLSIDRKTDAEMSGTSTGHAEVAPALANPDEVIIRSKTGELMPNNNL